MQNFQPFFHFFRFDNLILIYTALKFNVIRIFFVNLNRHGASDARSIDPKPGYYLFDDLLILFTFV